MVKEFIICAAIWYNDGKVHTNQPENIESGFVISGRRHGNCYASARALAEGDTKLLDRLNNLELSMVRGGEYDDFEGFMTSTNRYVNREDG